MMHVNPGNVNARVGRALQAYEDAVIEGNVVKASNILQGLLYRYASIFMKEPQKASYAAMPNLNSNPAQTKAQAFDALGDRLETVLRILRDEAGVFSKQPDLEDGDSSILDQENPALAM